MTTKILKKFKGESGGACPTYFKIKCREAKEGGTSGYHQAAWHLSIHLDSELDDYEIAINELEKLVDAKDDTGISEWFRYYLPRCMKLIPRRRLSTFVKGFWQAVEDGRVF